MRIWVDVHNAAGDRLGKGPIYNVEQASVTRSLDEAGSISITVPGTDERALELLTNKRRIRVFVETGGTIREVGRGIVENLRASNSSSGWQLSASGPDEIIELKDKSALLARIYNNEAVATVLSELAALAGWTIDTDISDSIYIRLDGENILKAVQAITEQQGLHLRLGDTARTLEIGAFGDDSGLRAIQVERYTGDLESNTDIMLIDRLQISEESRDLCNWLIPVGGGEGEAMLTLEHSTRTSPYTIQTMTGPDGRTLYYIADEDSITAYGQIEKVGAYKSINPLSNTDADIELAANALYDVASNWLLRHKDPLEVYTLSVRKVRQNIKPGQKINLRYKGIVYRDNDPFTYRNVNEDLWIMSVSESFGSGGSSCTLKVATIDRHEQDAVSIVLGALDSIEINNVKVQPYPNMRSYPYYREIAPSYPAQIPINITNATLYIQRITAKIITSPFRTTASAATSGGGSTSTSTSTSPAAVSTLFFNIVSTPNNHAHGLPSLSHDHDVTVPAHTHGITYEIADDSQTPVNISIYINGVDRTSVLGGPFAPSGGSLEFDLDTVALTNLIVNASGGMRQKHTIEIRCASGQGRIEALVEIYETVQSIALS